MIDRGAHYRLIRTRPLEPIIAPIGRKQPGGLGVIGLRDQNERTIGLRLYDHGFPLGVEG
jgi:hypothetical protein